jgi:hypothetical protein
MDENAMNRIDSVDCLVQISTMSTADVAAAVSNDHQMDLSISSIFVSSFRPQSGPPVEAFHLFIFRSCGPLLFRFSNFLPEQEGSPFNGLHVRRVTRRTCYPPDGGAKTKQNALDIPSVAFILFGANHEPGMPLKILRWSHSHST